MATFGSGMREIRRDAVRPILLAAILGSALKKNERHGGRAEPLTFEAILSTETSLLETARRLAEAERQGDVRALDALMAADYTGYDPAGRPRDRSSVIRAYAEGGVRVTALAQSELRARVLGEIGLVTGVSAFQGRQGEECFDFTLRFLDVYAWREGRWQLVASQATRLPW